jgi:hypothetical protein
MFQDPEKNEIFRCRCVIAQESETRQTLQSVESKLDQLNDELESNTELFHSVTSSIQKKLYEETIIVLIGKVRTLTSQRKEIKRQLSIVEPEEDGSSATLGYLAEKANEKLIELASF